MVFTVRGIIVIPRKVIVELLCFRFPFPFVRFTLRRTSSPVVLRGRLTGQPPSTVRRPRLRPVLRRGGPIITRRVGIGPRFPRWDTGRTCDPQSKRRGRSKVRLTWRRLIPVVKTRFTWRLTFRDRFGSLGVPRLIIPFLIVVLSVIISDRVGRRRFLINRLFRLISVSTNRRELTVVLKVNRRFIGTCCQPTILLLRPLMVRRKNLPSVGTMI